MRPSNCFSPSDFQIAAFDENAKTFEMTVNVHPGQARILDYFVKSEHLKFYDREQVVRWCIAWGTNTLFGPLPNSFRLIEAKMNVLHDERFERQRTCIGESVQKYLAVGEKDNARRIVAIAAEDYARITNKYFRELWMSTLQPAIQMLEEHGIRLALNR